MSFSGYLLQQVFVYVLVTFWTFCSADLLQPYDNDINEEEGSGDIDLMISIDASIIQSSSLIPSSITYISIITSYENTALPIMPYTTEHITESSYLSLSQATPTLSYTGSLNSLTTPISSPFSVSVMSTVILSATPTPSGRVPIVTVTVLNATSLYVTWTIVYKSTGYNIYVREELNTKKRQADEFIIYIRNGHVTSHVISGLKPYTSYSISMASIDENGVIGQRSLQTTPIITNEAVPSLPRNVSVDYISGRVLITWLRPLFPNGVISMYTVLLMFVNGTDVQYIVPGNQTYLNISRPNIEFSVLVLATNGAGTSENNNLTTGLHIINYRDLSYCCIISNIVSVTPTTTSVSKLSNAVIGSIAAFCVLMVLLIVIIIVIILIIVVRHWYKYTGGEDINVDEIEYKSGDLTNYKNDSEDDIDGQLTAKRWMRANANYSVPTLLLPSISELVSNYKTAEDLVAASNTVVRPHPPAVLPTIVEPQNPIIEQTHSNNSSSERSCDAHSTLSSVCSKKQKLPANTLSNTLAADTHSVAGIRDSRLINDDQALFEMMENVYLASPKETECLNDLELSDPSNLLDIKEQVGFGNYTKVMRGSVNSTHANFTKNNEVAIKVLQAETNPVDYEAFIGAACIMTHFMHKNILNILGIVTHSIPHMTIHAYASLGDLKHFLTRVRRKTRLESQPCNFGLIQQLLISFQIAAGMEYLSSKFFIHRALQAKYILLNEDYSLKIGGFRMSHRLAKPGGYYELKTADALPIKWLSLETLINGKFTSNTDIWSFGVVLWEIFAFGLTPFRGVNNDDILQHLKDGKRLNKPNGCPDNIYALMIHCWNENARDRPSFTILHSHLLGYHDKILQETLNQSSEDLSADNSKALLLASDEHDVSDVQNTNKCIHDTIELSITDSIYHNTSSSGQNGNELYTML